MLFTCRDAVQASEEAVALAQEQVDLLTGRSSVEKAPEPHDGQGGAGNPQAALLHLKALLEQHIVVSWGSTLWSNCLSGCVQQDCTELCESGTLDEACWGCPVAPVPPAGASHPGEIWVVPASSFSLVKQSPFV